MSMTVAFDIGTFILYTDIQLRNYVRNEEYIHLKMDVYLQFNNCNLNIFQLSNQVEGIIHEMIQIIKVL